MDNKNVLSYIEFCQYIQDIRDCLTVTNIELDIVNNRYTLYVSIPGIASRMLYYYVRETDSYHWHTCSYDASPFVKTLTKSYHTLAEWLYDLSSLPHLDDYHKNRLLTNASIIDNDIR